MKKSDVLKILFELNATQWRLAEAVGVSEPTLGRGLEVLRKEVQE